MFNHETPPLPDDPANRTPTDLSVVLLWEIVKTMTYNQADPHRASDIRGELTPDPATEADISWVRNLMRDEPLVAMTTSGAKATIPMYSVFTTRPDGKLRFLFRSFESTDHATVIDEAVAAGVGRAAVQLLLYRSTDLNVGLELFGQASRVSPEQLPAFEEIYQDTRRARGHGPGEHWGKPEIAMYVVEDWTTLQIQSRLRDAEGKHISNGKAEVREEQLNGFEEP